MDWGLSHASSGLAEAASAMVKKQETWGEGIKGSNQEKVGFEPEREAPQAGHWQGVLSAVPPCLGAPQCVAGDA